jgi:DNA-binding transcriptional MerR regulator
MKICVLNFSGNVGKSTVAAHLLQPRLKAPVFSVESVNVDAQSDGVDVQRLRARQFNDLMAELMVLPDAVVDVGSSNIETFLKQMQQYDGSQEEFDWFIVPVVKDAKQQADTVNTVRALRAIGVPAEKIRVLINKVDADDDLRHDFSAVMAFCEGGHATLPDRAVIYENDVFAGLKSLRMTIGDLNADNTDYRQKLREATDEAGQHAAIQMIGYKRLARTCNKNLDTAYEALFAA